MSEVALTEQLDQAIDAMVRSSGGPLPAVDQEIAELLGIAAELRDLPRGDFKANLKHELEKEISMSTAAESIQGVDKSARSKGKSVRSKDKLARSKVRERVQTVTPYVVVSDVHQEIDFVQ